jgi:hypothetical protein
MLTSVRRSDIWDSTGITGIAKALFRQGRGWTVWLKGNRLEELMERHLRAKTFEACPRALYVISCRHDVPCSHPQIDGRLAGTVANHIDQPTDRP